MNGCSVCKRDIDENKAPILVMGGYGHPRYLCQECSEQLERATLSHDVSEIEAAMSSTSQKLADSGTEDDLTVRTVADIFAEAGERAKRIKEGTYDFSEDETEELRDCEQIFDELSESEEDAILDERDAERAKKADKIFNIVALIAFGAAIVAFIIIMLTR